MKPRSEPPMEGVRPNLMNCPNCGAAMRLEKDREYFTCDYCKSLHFPAPNADGIRVLGEPSELECPLCWVPLVHAAAGGQRVLYCERCRGLLAAMDVFLVMLEELRAARRSGSQPRPTNWDELRRQILCPECQTPMHTHPYAGPGNVVIDNCPRCRLNWLDHAELRRITAAP